MRHYDRHQYRHLDDAERYRDYDYLADDSWTGPNERMVQPANAHSREALDGDEMRLRAGDGGGRERLGGDSIGTRRERSDHERRRWDEPESGRRARRDTTDRSYRAASGDTTQGARTRRRPKMLVRSILASLAHTRDVIRERVRRLFVRSGLGHRTEPSPRREVRSDRRIHEEIVARFARTRDLDAREIEVDVRGGEVILEGFVVDRRSRYLAEDLLEDVLGISDVMNRLHVRQRAWRRS